MLHRLAIIVITGFWLAMTSLLVVREFYPQATRLNAVPVSYVGQVVFQHEQASDLRIFASGKEAGFVHVQPRNMNVSGRRDVDLNGSITLTIPGGRPQRFAWAAVFGLRHDFTLERLRLDLSTPEPGQHLDIAANFPTKKVTLRAKVGEQIVSETAVTLDEVGLNQLLSRAKVDPMMLRQFQASHSALPPLDFSAQSSTMVISGQKLSTVLLSLHAGGQAIFDAEVSQLGQVLRAQIPLLGWKLTPFNSLR